MREHDQETLKRVVIIGSDYGANTIMRRVFSYKHTAVFQVSRDAVRPQFPNADLAIICIRVIGHEMHAKARAQYRAQKTPLLIVKSGWSDICGAFENWLQEAAGEVVRRGGVPKDPAVSTFQDAMTKAVEEAREPEAEKPAPRMTAQEMPIETVRQIAVWLRQPKQPVARVVALCDEGGLTWPNGSPIDARDVYRLTHRYRLKDESPLVDLTGFTPFESLDTPVPPAEAPPGPAIEVPRAVGPQTPHDLIGRVLALTNISPARRLELIEEIHAGVRTTDRQVIAEHRGPNLQFTEQSIYHGGDRALLTLTKVQAAAVLELLEAVKKFVETEEPEA